MGTAGPNGVHQQLVARVLDGDGRAPRAWRRAAFDAAGPEDRGVRTLVEKVATRPTQVTDDDFGAAARAGLSADQVWELIICAAIGESSRQYEGALEAVAAAEEPPS